MKIFCDECGIIPKAHYDGYAFGDRMLEGVMFEVEVVGSELITKGVKPSNKDYFSDFNEKKWLETANESLEDVVAEHGEGLNCPKSFRHEVILVNDDGSEITSVSKPGLAVEITPMKDLLTKISGDKKAKKIKLYKGLVKLEDFLRDADNYSKFLVDLSEPL